MAEGRLNLEPEVQEILSCVDNYRNFLLSGGAGSGKTYSLVQLIRQLINEQPSCKVACMTYTNAAVKEIEDRVNHKNLNVSTIHDFLWDSIKHFQKELRASLVTLINDDEVSKMSISDTMPIADDYFDHLVDGIQYKEFLRIKDGIISHDELLIIAECLFKTYPKLSDVIKDKYKFIFIDEYQDTNVAVIKILLEHLNSSSKKNIIGFFGDSMQAIYDDGIGNLEEYIGDIEGGVYEVIKPQNRRNPKKIIELANRLRLDNIKQTPSHDEKAPNMLDGEVKEGRVLFLYSKNADIDIIKQFLSDNYEWDFTSDKITKELNLTHNLIADKAGFRTLMDIYDKDQVLSYRNRIKKYIKDNEINTDFSDNTFGEVIEILKEGKTGTELNKVSPTNSMRIFIDNNEELYNTALGYQYGNISKIYVDKEQLIDDKKQTEKDINKKGSKRDALIRHLFKIQNNIHLYTEGNYNEFLRVTDYRHRILCTNDKIILKQNIENLVDVGNKTIEEIINDAHEKGVCLIDENLEKFQSDKEYIYNRVKEVSFTEFQNLYKYLEGKTPFSTQHKTKGTEFDNILVILDNGGWNNYNFKYLFEEGGTESVLARTQKIFYVCCTRAKENLAVFYHEPTEGIVTKAKEWFGNENVIEI